jgi:peptidylamidoglycolate lyase
MAARFALTFAAFAALSCDEGPAPVDPGPTPGASYAPVEGWPRLPAGVVLGRVTAVAVDAAGLVYVAHDAGAGGGERPIAAPTLLVFDPGSGELVRSFGAGLFRLPHALAFDRDGHLWVTDSEADRVYELDRDGRVLRALGGG